eukprot:gene2799-2842_t
MKPHPSLIPYGNVPPAPGLQCRRKLLALSALKLRVMGIEPTPGTAEQYRDEIKRDLDRYGAVVKAAGISIE